MTLRLVLGLWLMLMGGGWVVAQDLQARSVLRLTDPVGPVTIGASLDSFLDPSSKLTLTDIDQMPDRQFSQAPRGPVKLDGGTLWQRFDVVLDHTSRPWYLTVPLPALDEATLYFRDNTGQWAVQDAGDMRAMSRWALPGRYPVFSLSSDQNAPVRYYLKIRHARVPYSAVPQLMNDAQLIGLRQNEHLLLGIYFGLAMLVVILASVNAVAYRDSGFGTYAVYVALLSAAQGITTGVAGIYWWPESPHLNNAGAMLLLSLASAAALWFVRTVTHTRKIVPRLDLVMQLLMVALPLCGLLNVVFLNATAFAVYNALVSLTMVALVSALLTVAVRGDPQLRWVAFGFLPIGIAALFPLLRNYGVIESSFLTLYALMVGSAIETPVLFYGLYKRLIRSRLPTSRVRSLQTVDPLTGLHSPGVLVGRLRQALSVAMRQQQPFAILMVNLVNLGTLQHEHGRETGERALVMAAARIRAVARPTDTVARAGDSQFALLMDGPVSSVLANDIATKILASGLRPSDELPDAEPLRFHIAIGHLDNMASLPDTKADGCFSRMLRAVREMNDGSRKAIRRVQL
jgi:diguanylate cyclase (GGDEF)-like protein